jgi:hypothetical protein
MSDHDGDDYEVGFGKPPKHTRFRKGQSGNPKGRPKGSKNLATDLGEEMRERIRIRENGKVVKITKQRAIIKSIIAKAVTGVPRAVDLVTRLCERLLEDDAGDVHSTPLQAEDQEIISAFLRQIRDFENDAD